MPQGYRAEQGRLQFEAFELPPLAADEVRIEVHYSGVNRADLVQLSGHYPPPPGVTELLGLEVSGRIIACGSEVQQLQVGQLVCALLAGGGYAEQVQVAASQVLPIPDGISLVDAAGIVEVFATAWLNLFELAKLQPGEQLLVHAGASAVGLAAIQLARWRGHRCFVTVSSQEKLARCLALGATAGHLRGDGDFTEAVQAFGGADVILDCVGGHYLAANQQVLKADGRLVLIGLLGGRMGQIDLGRLLMLRQQLLGSTLRSLPLPRKAELLTQMRYQLWPAFSAGHLHATIDTVYAAVDAAQALQRLASNATLGKLLLRWPAAKAPQQA